MTVRTRSIFAVAFALLAASCGDIGAPTLVSRDTPPQERLVGCHNVAANYPHQPFSGASYFTTWGSALQEGAAVGAREGLLEGGGVGTLVLMQMAPPDEIGGEPVIWRNAVQPAFCMRVPVSAQRLERGLERALAELRVHGYQVSTIRGDFVTNFVPRSHSAARWVDRFRARVVPVSSEESAVYVFREIAISRQGAPFVEASSIGRLEAGILSRSRDIAMGRPVR